VNPNTGGPWAETPLKRAWYKACAKVGVRVSLYSGTKHSTATELRRQGVPLDVIQKLCGHRDARSTEVYAKLADQALVEAIRRPRMRSARRSPGGPRNYLIYQVKLVEAAGIEPASAWCPTSASTCVVSARCRPGSSR